MNWSYLSQALSRIATTRHVFCCWKLLALLFLGSEFITAAETNNVPLLPAWLAQPLSLVGALNIALQRNSTILKSTSDLEATNGLVVQTRAVAYPTISGTANYTHASAVERLDLGSVEGIINPPKDAWAGNIRLTQSIYEGGRIRSALRQATWLQEQALLQHQVVVADALREVRVGYYDAMLAQEQVGVYEASVKLLEEELTNTIHRLEAGTVSRFEVLRAEVELVKSRTDLIKASNTARLAKYRLSNLLGCNIPPNMQDDLPLTLMQRRETFPFDVLVPTAITQALARRAELAVQKASLKVRKENIIQATGGYRPKLDIYGGYGARNPGLENDFWRYFDGPNAGVEFDWDLYNGGATRGEVIQAEAQLRKAQTTFEDTKRQIETEVRIAFSRLAEGRAVLASQQKVQEQAEEALRLAERRYEVGANTQLDLLQAQTDLTQARTTQNRAWRDYAVALAELTHALGQDTPTDNSTPSTNSR